MSKYFYLCIKMAVHSLAVVGLTPYIALFYWNNMCFFLTKKGYKITLNTIKYRGGDIAVL